MKNIHFTRVLSLALVLALCTVLLGGCTKEEKEDVKIKVAFLLPGAINDQGWNAMAYNGLQEIEKNFDAATSYLESVTKQDMEAAYRNYASEGYDVVFGHGFEFSSAAEAVAKDFPNTRFIVTSSDLSVAPNVGSITTANMEIGFLLGLVGGVVSETGTMGALNGLESPQVSETIAGMTAGLKYANPDAKLISNYTGSFDDAGKAREMTVAMSEQGVDIIQGDPNQMSLGILEACEQTGMKYLGVYGDFSANNPDVVVSSGMMDFGKAMSSIVKLIQEGTWEPIQYSFGIKEGVAFLAPFGKFDETMTKEQKDFITDTVDKIKSGELVVRDLVEADQ